MTPDPAAPAKESWWRAESLAAAPVSRVAFAVQKPAFHRPVRIRVSDDGETWRTVASGEIYRLVAGTGGSADRREALHVDFPETSARMVRVEVINRDDPPLEGALRIVDAETGDELEVTVDQDLRRLYQHRLERRLHEVERFCRQRSVEYLRASTAIAFEDVVLKYLRQGVHLR